MSKTSILIVSYSADLDWLKWCINSIEIFASGFHSTVIAWPKDELQVLFASGLNRLATVKLYDRVHDRKKWHLHHQAVKCMADTLCPEADFILHTDSDCIFTEKVTPQDYFIDGKPVLLVESFKRIGFSNWKETTDKALGIDSKWETMRRHPAVHYREIYGQFRSAVERHTKMRFLDYVLSCKADFPWGFSEFNALGNFIVESPELKSKYAIIDLELQPRPKDKLLQFWSHWGLTGTITDKGHNFGKRPIDIIKSIVK